ncbi:MAG: rhomboid family intramembrane serine protease [Myxococcota bacterium]
MSDGWFSRSGRRPSSPRTVDWGRRVRQDGERSNQVLFGLIAINVLVFLLWTQSAGTILEQVMASQFLVSVESIVHLRVWTLLTAEFSHISPTHLLFNMLGLWVFGREVGQTLGWRDLLNLYLVGAVVASLGHVVFGLVTGDPAPSLGASGAVYAISVVYAAMFPNRTLMINFLIPVPAAVAVAGYILLDLFGAFGMGGGGVAHAAHLGGAAYGLAFWWWRTQRGGGPGRR